MKWLKGQSPKAVEQALHEWKTVNSGVKALITNAEMLFMEDEINIHAAGIGKAFGGGKDK